MLGDLLIPEWFCSEGGHLSRLCFPDPVSLLTCGLCASFGMNTVSYNSSASVSSYSCCRWRKWFRDYSFFVWHLWLCCHRWKTERRLSAERSDRKRSGTLKMQVDLQCSKFSSTFSHHSAAFSFWSVWVRGGLLWLIKFCWQEWPSTCRTPKKKIAALLF